MEEIFIPRGYSGLFYCSMAWAPPVVDPPDLA